jgi:hypothetical protein
VYVKNVTISVDERLLDRARTAARQQGSSLNALLRQYIRSLAGIPSSAEVADRLIALMRESAGHSGGRKVTRDEAYEGRV